MAQAIRRRIEVLIPEALAGWARAAKRLRQSVAERLPSAAGRRAFWERFADLAFAEDPGRNAETRLLAEIDRVAARQPKGGRVTLVGVGPGDVELLTIKAVRTLQQADVIVFDDRVSDAVLALARREAERLRIGKRVGRASLDRESVGEIVLKLARNGRHVVLLESGNAPFFGRDPEEIDALGAAGIPVDTVPGVAASAGMPCNRASPSVRSDSRSASFAARCAAPSRQQNYAYG